jgi:hypothetical protein
MSWPAMVETLKSEPHESKIFWFHDLKQFTGWKKFVQYLVKRCGAISFTHKARTSVAQQYAGQRIMVFSLVEVAASDDLEHVYDDMRKLKSGVLFCTECGVKTFPMQHVVVFADFPVQRGSEELAPLAPVKAIAEAPAEAPAEAHAEAHAEALEEAYEEALTVENILA